MKAIDWANSESYYNKLVADLMEYCVTRGLSSTAQGNKFTITLPTAAEIDVWPEHKKRKAFNIADWGPKGIDETSPIPDDFQLPDTGEILEEGEPPKGDPKEEK